MLKQDKNYTGHNVVKTVFFGWILRRTNTLAKLKLHWEEELGCSSCIISGANRHRSGTTDICFINVGKRNESEGSENEFT
jgi:hypothetical protein